MMTLRVSYTWILVTTFVCRLLKKRKECLPNPVQQWQKWDWYFVDVKEEDNKKLNEKFLSCPYYLRHNAFTLYHLGL